jgi:hypothetical protein
MGRTTAIKEKGSDSRRSDTKGDFSLGTNCGSDSVADPCLSTTSCTEKEKDLPPVIVDRVHDPIECFCLLRIEMRKTVINPLSHLDRIISKLLAEDRVIDDSSPLLLWSIHVLYVRKTLSTGLYGEELNEMKAIIEDIIVCRIWNTASDEPVT